MCVQNQSSAQVKDALPNNVVPSGSSCSVLSDGDRPAPYEEAIPKRAPKAQKFSADFQLLLDSYSSYQKTRAIPLWTLNVFKLRELSQSRNLRITAQKGGYLPKHMLIHNIVTHMCKSLSTSSSSTSTATSSTTTST